MPSLSLPPFLDLPQVDGDAAPDAAVQTSPWSRRVGEDEDESLGTHVRGWDYGMPMQLHRRVIVHPSRVRDATGLSPSSIMRLVVTWSTRRGYHTGGRGFSKETSLNSDEVLEFLPTVDVPSAQLAGDLRMTTCLVLARAGTDSQPLAARQPGSILWQDVVDTSLEGMGERLPVSLSDFTNRYDSLSAGAAWSIELSHDWLHRHPSVGMVVLINSARVEVTAALKSERPGPAEQLIRSALYHDVGRTLVLRALDSDEFRSDEPYDTGTLGYALRLRIRTLFPHYTFNEVYQMPREELERVLQSHHQLFKSA